MSSVIDCINCSCNVQQSLSCVIKWLPLCINVSSVYQCFLNCNTISYIMYEAMMSQRWSGGDCNVFDICFFFVVLEISFVSCITNKQN